MAAGAGYAENLRKLATFRTLEEFWGVYTHLLRADELPKVAIFFFLAFCSLLTHVPFLSRIPTITFSERVIFSLVPPPLVH
jgi:hypothetical protein